MYGKHFGFAELPFSVTPDPRFSYVNSDYREAFASLRCGTEPRRGFCVITGGGEPGKRPLLQGLLHRGGAPPHPAFFFKPIFIFPNSPRLVLNGWGGANPAGEKQPLGGGLNHFLIE